MDIEELEHIIGAIFHTLHVISLTFSKCNFFSLQLVLLNIRRSETF
jgi:hypothetical protein